MIFFSLNILQSRFNRFKWWCGSTAVILQILLYFAFRWCEKQASYTSVCLENGQRWFIGDKLRALFILEVFLIPSQPSMIFLVALCWSSFPMYEHCKLNASSQSTGFCATQCSYIPFYTKYFERKTVMLLKIYWGYFMPLISNTDLETYVYD